MLVCRLYVYYILCCLCGIIISSWIQELLLALEVFVDVDGVGSSSAVAETATSDDKSFIARVSGLPLISDETSVSELFPGNDVTLLWPLRSRCHSISFIMTYLLVNRKVCPKVE